MAYEDRAGRDDFWETGVEMPNDPKNNNWPVNSQGQQPGYYVTSPAYSNWSNQNPGHAAAYDPGAPGAPGFADSDYWTGANPIFPQQNTSTPSTSDGDGGTGGSGNGGGGGGTPPAQSRSPYQAPAFTPSPFIMPNGQVPPGMPFSPNTEMQGLQDQLLQRMLTTPAFGPEYLNALNEQQKELALGRGQAAQRSIMQRAASRGVQAGGTVRGQLRRADDEVSRNLLQSNRDVSLQTEGANRQGFLDALTMSEGVLGGRQDRGLNLARLIESIRQYDQDLLNRQAEFGTGMTFNYDNLNANNYNSWLDYLARLGGQ